MSAAVPALLRLLLIAAGWAAGAWLALVAPGNLVMRLSFGMLDDPALAAQIALTIGGVALVVAVERWRHRTAPRRPESGTPAAWARAVTIAAAAVPLFGFSLPHLLWVLGVPFGVTSTQAADIAGGGVSAGWTFLIAGPVVGAGLTSGLVKRWGQVIPSWAPLVGGRRVPRWLPVVLTVPVGLLIGQYGAMMTGCLTFGMARRCAPAGGTEVLDGNWGFTATYPIFLLWGALLLLAAAGYADTTRSSAADRPRSGPRHGAEPPRKGRFRTAWTAAHAPVPGVPRWARIVAYAIPYTVLPSSLWRIAAVVFHAPIVNGDVEGGTGNLPSWMPLEVYVVILSVVSEVLAFSAVGLIARWGEVFPRWVPGLRGRRVPTAFAVIPAALGATVLTVLWTTVAAQGALGRTLQGKPITSDNPLAMHDSFDIVVFFASYAPLLLWGPLLGALTIAYWRRRRRTRPE
ncbi:hypothetical protein [Nonomuraea phyllanthi]|uniref:hypothetical protein n=1 Tax=Nonomuraea phyllanthi TaxID=2219224 RepID=UPI001D15CE5A|nr:hypothetical protein [Nonomuraea phyllanthi]